MASTALPNEKYNSGGVPHGAIFVDIYRPTDPANPGGGAAKLGTYRCESANPKRGSEVTKRPDIDAGPNGWFMTDKDIEGNAVIQRNVAATPTVQNGDYFDAYAEVDANGNNIARRYVCHDVDYGLDAGYRKMSCSIIVDQSAVNPTPRNPLNGN